jgi:hypothetical protein
MAAEMTLEEYVKEQFQAVHLRQGRMEGKLDSVIKTLAAHQVVIGVLGVVAGTLFTALLGWILH